MSSSELVSYFKYLLANARRLYVDFVRNRSFAREYTGVKTKWILLKLSLLLAFFLHSLFCWVLRRGVIRFFLSRFGFWLTFGRADLLLVFWFCLALLLRLGLFSWLTWILSLAVLLLGGVLLLILFLGLLTTLWLRLSFETKRCSKVSFQASHNNRIVNFFSYLVL